MGKHKSKTTGKGRLDRFYYLAKEQGFRSRAAFKLVQLDRKFRFLEKASSVLDLCAAPGGWIQVASKNTPVGSLIIGVDLAHIRPIRGVFTLQEDITSLRCKSSIRKLMKDQGHNTIDVVLHDGSPNVGGAWSSEATSQAALVLDALKLAVEFLAPEGTLVSKVFRSQDYTALLYAFKQLFDKVEVTKPVASRSTSAEIYIVGLKYRAPGKIDPRLLDARHLFKEVAEFPKVVDVLKESKRRRHRDGYEDGRTTLFRDHSAAVFVWAERPLDLLASVTSISFADKESAHIRDLPATTKEIKTLCQDLRVLGKQEFKQLFKWRIQVRSALDTARPKELEHLAQNSEVFTEDVLLTEMEELKEAMEAKKRRVKKLASKRKAKAKARTATGLQVDVMMDKYGDDDLFSLMTIKAKKDLVRIGGAESCDGDEDHLINDDDSLNSSSSEKTEMDASDYDSDVDRQRYDAELEKYLERAYDIYCNTTDGSTTRRKRVKLDSAETKGGLWEEGDAPLRLQSAGLVKPPNEDKNPLLMNFFGGALISEKNVVENWFNQEIFADHKSRLEERNLEELVQLNKKQTAFHPSDSNMLTVHGHAGSDDPLQSDDNVDFHVAPPEDSVDDSSSDDSDSNLREKTETLAYAKNMLRKKGKDFILEDAYNRYTFDDRNLPKWFADDEKKHSKAVKPVTKEDIEAMQSHFRDINARPTKKVAEAKARKKRRAAKKLEQVRAKATAIADQDDLSTTVKRKQMERLYAKASAATSEKGKRKVVIARKSVGAKSGKGRIVVDRRMKSDRRHRGAGKSGKTSGKGKGKVSSQRESTNHRRRR